VSIRWYCADCRASIEDAQGFLGVSFQAIAEALRGGTRPAQWRPLHDRCARDEAPGYWLGVEEIRDEAAVRAWTDHLSRKSWLAVTTWDLVVAHAADELGREARASRRRAA
jgi:hypothetical protein